MESANEIIIRNEDEAFAVIEGILARELEGQPVVLKFDAWPVLEIRLEGEGYESTITADMAAALVELQHAINRSYARLVHQSTNARTLTAEERHRLQFKAKVEEGCTKITVQLDDFLRNVAQSVVDKMEPGHLVITVVGLAVVAGGVVAYKHFLQGRTESKKIDAEAQQRIALSKEETRRMEVMAGLIRSHPVLDQSRQDFDAARHEIVRGTSDAKSLAVNSVELDRESARVIAATKRSETVEVQLNGNYVIRKTDWQQDDEVRLKISNVDTGREFVASFRDKSLDGEQLKLLQQAEWNRRQVYMSINATELRGEITTAAIVGVTFQPESSTGGFPAP